ncbi:hypothetical protein [Halopseudomonas sp.]|jgi:hypothetical protein|uniref:hypothetical protein n=1 Tax=Halopseudomonas sp. TaxID=2901191 RepID=UPI001A46D618|nr:hypothetical protein [Pseudomonas sp.]|tara:strand:+ start:348 stop:635 length:288 start_codon:yes stop_codon:yes gene_type:complete
MPTPKTLARQLFAPLLDKLEGGDQPHRYTPRARLILWVTGLLFLGLSTGLAVFLPEGTDPAALIPIGIFGLVGFFAVVVAWLGSERAVARVWGSR